MVLGQTGVGKTALVVRFVTRRYIGEYDPTLEKIYTYHTIIDNEMVCFDILDTAGQPHESECLALEANIRWAEAFILVYSVTDKCSFDECNRLKFLINYNKRRRRLGGGSKDGIHDVPVLLVGNKTDQSDDRMVSLEEGQKRSKEIGCVCFHEISVRESIEQVFAVFRDVCRFWRMQSKCPNKLKRSGSEKEAVSPDTVRFICSSTISPVNTTPLNTKINMNRRWTDIDLEEDAESESSKASTSSSPSESIVPFRERASTDGHLIQKPWRWRYPPPAAESNPEMFYSRANRRMSISMKGNNASY
ncbi:hypothetical protein RN001_004779 [Aquatica leii]|uniref:small monomeric GTPase n=1 Tax=Aquatica leii TaxID=1421715 RepID=A0AAN7SRV7_9COLE|nr:hypothetical protein RN001_004779 [Aquatica leii]